MLGGARQQYAYPASGLTGYGIKQALKFGDFIKNFTTPKDIERDQTLVKYQNIFIVVIYYVQWKRLNI